MLLLALGCSAAPSRFVTFDVALLAISHACHAGKKSQLAFGPRRRSFHAFRATFDVMFLYIRHACHAHVAQTHPCLVRTPARAHVAQTRQTLAHGEPAHANVAQTHPRPAHGKHTRPRACPSNARTPVVGCWLFLVSRWLLVVSCLALDCFLFVVCCGLWVAGSGLWLVRYLELPVKTALLPFNGVEADFSFWTLAKPSVWLR